MRARLRLGRIACVLGLGTFGLVAIGGPAHAGTAVVVKPPSGAAKPVAATGVGTRAALENPRCRTGEEGITAYGRWDASSLGGGPLCVVPFEDGADNGGATSRGVTKKSIKLVVVLPSAAVAAQQSAAAQLVDQATGAQGKWEDAVHDYLVSNAPYYETWGRDIDVTLYTSTGPDETAQRADAVAIEALKPFAVVNHDADGLDTLMASLARSKILTMSYGVSPSESQAQAPYRWGGGDADAAALASAEVIGRNLVGKEAQYAGADLQGTTRTFGLVQAENLIDDGRFERALRKHKGTLASKDTYPGSGGSLGDAAVAQEQAPTIVARMKDAGVTTVVLFSDLAMVKAMMTHASEQNWFPEWFETGASTWSVPILAQSLPKEQQEHTFGISYPPPFFDQPDELEEGYGFTGALNWYFGTGRGTASNAVPGLLTWFLNGVHLAGPNLTPKTFRQGTFADPGVQSLGPLSFSSGFGRVTGLPYDAYSPGPADFMPLWLDPNTRSLTFAGPAGGIEAGTTAWFVTDDVTGKLRRYSLGDWPKDLQWFDPSSSVKAITLEGSGIILRGRADPCPSGVCTVEPGASGTSFVVVTTSHTEE